MPVLIREAKRSASNHVFLGGSHVCPLRPLQYTWPEMEAQLALSSTFAQKRLITTPIPSKEQADYLKKQPKESYKYPNTRRLLSIVRKKIFQTLTLFNTVGLCRSDLLSSHKTIFGKKSGCIFMPHGACSTNQNESGCMHKGVPTYSPPVRSRDAAASSV